MSESALEVAAIAKFEKMAKANQKLREEIARLQELDDDPNNWIHAKCRHHIHELDQKIIRLEKLVEEAFKEGFSDGVTAGHPMGSRSSDSEAWEHSYSKEQVSDEEQ